MVRTLVGTSIRGMTSMKEINENSNESPFNESEFSLHFVYQAAFSSSYHSPNGSHLLEDYFDLKLLHNTVLQLKTEPEGLDEYLILREEALHNHQTLSISQLKIMYPSKALDYYMRIYLIRAVDASKQSSEDTQDLEWSCQFLKLKGVPLDEME